MAIQSGKFANARLSVWNRVRFQLGIGIILAALAPWLIRVQSAVEELRQPSLQVSLAGTLLALMSGYYAFRRLSRYPGVRSSYSILPAFAVTYAMVLAIFFFLRLDYSRAQFLASFIICVVWHYTVYFKLQRQTQLRIGVVSFGEVQSLFDIAGVNWVSLTDTRDYGGPYDAIVADLRADIPDNWARFLTDRALEGTLVMHVKQIEESLTGRVAIEHLSENTLGSLMPGIVYGKIKRVGDFIFALLALPLLAPLLAIVAIAIRVDSGGSVLFLQERMGYRGRTFRMYKFRTMFSGSADPADARAALTVGDDARVTRLGKFLRLYRIDELPQLINILKGEMSWIGPRPEAVALFHWYQSEVPFYRYRHIVRPGITGWAQVKQGYVGEIDDVLWKLHYDFYYIKNFSFWLDLLIVARTIQTILTGFGTFQIGTSSPAGQAQAE